MSPAVLAAAPCAITRMSRYNRFYSFHCCDYDIEQVGGGLCCPTRRKSCTQLVLLRGINARKPRCHDLDPFADHYTG